MSTVTAPEAVGSRLGGLLAIAGGVLAATSRVIQVLDFLRYTMYLFLASWTVVPVMAVAVGILLTRTPSRTWLPGILVGLGLSIVAPDVFLGLASFGAEHVSALGGFDYSLSLIGGSLIVVGGLIAGRNQRRHETAAV
jgi:hypothetical protein